MIAYDYLGGVGVAMLAGWAYLVRLPNVTPGLTGIVRQLLFLAVLVISFHVQGLAELFVSNVRVRLEWVGAIAALLIGAMFTTQGARRVNTFPHAKVISVLRADPLLWMFFGVITLGLVLTFVMVGLGRPGGYESHAYHLPVALHILEGGTLLPWDRAYVHTYPANGSLIYAVVLALAPENIASIAEALFLPLLVQSTYGIARLAGADRAGAVIAALGLATIPLISFSAVAPAGGIAGPALLAAGLILALDKGHATVGQFVLSGVALGLACGFKPLYLPATVFIACLAMSTAWQTSEDLVAASTRVVRALTAMAAFTIGSLAVFGFWMVRGTMLFDNPLYPFTVPIIGSMLGWEVAPDIILDRLVSADQRWVSGLHGWITYPWKEWTDSVEGFRQSSGLGAFFATAVPVSLLAAVPYMFFRNLHRGEVSALTLGAFFSIVVWWSMGYREPRYAMGFMVFAVPLVGRTVALIDYKLLRRTFESLLGVSIAFMTFVVFFKALVAFGHRVNDAHLYTRANEYDYPAVLDTLKPGTVINAAFRSWNYSLAGARFQHRVKSYEWTVSRFGGNRKDCYFLSGCEPPDTFNVPRGEIACLGETYLFALDGRVEIQFEEGVRSVEIARLQRDQLREKPYAGRLHFDRVLYRLEKSSIDDKNGESGGLQGSCSEWSDRL